MDKKDPELARFCPPPSGDLELWLAPLLAIPGAAVLDLHGLRVPRLKPSDADILDKLADDTAHVVSRVGDGETIGQPGRYFRLRLEASYRHRIEGLDTVAVRDHLGLRDTPDVVTRDPHGEDQERSRSAARVIKNGDDLWSRLGAWPWAAFTGGLKGGWRAETEAAHTLAHWHAAAVGSGSRILVEQERRLRRGVHGPARQSD